MSTARRPQVIVVTDGDPTAWEAVKTAAEDLGLIPIAASRGNPTPGSAEDIVRAIGKTDGDPVVVLVDDQGDAGPGAGERVLDRILHAPDLDVLGVVAVASHTPGVRGVKTVLSVTRSGDRVEGAVDKEGRPTDGRLHGDTVDVVEDSRVPVVGLGDPGKMDGGDAAERGFPVTREALRAVLEQVRHQAH